MKLTRYSDYALRLCLFLAADASRRVSIAEASRACGVPQSNLMKLTTDLAGAGLLQTTRGRGGGIRLARPADEITMAQIVRHTEGATALVDCSDCPFAPDCGLICVLAEAKRAFFDALDAHSLQDVAARTRPLPIVTEG